MLSAPKIPSTEVKEEEDEVVEEEAKGLQLQRRKPIIVIHTQIIHITLTTLRVKGEKERYGPISPMFNVTTARSMGTMNVNAERSKRTRTITRTIAEPMSPKKKEARQS